MPGRTLLSAALLLATLACRDDAESPTEPSPLRAEATPAMALSFDQVSAGRDNFSCGVTADDQAYCWGRNYRGQLGDGTTATARLTPVPVATTLRFQQVSAGWQHTCAVTPDHRVYCWGFNGAGALGDGSTTDHYTPEPIADGLKFRQVAAGFDFTCGVTYPDSRAYCWGNNYAGQLGDGTMTTRLRPRAVIGGLYFKHVRTGGHHTCGITTTNRAYCWGYNANGELGDSTTVWRLRPTRVAAGSRRFRQIAPGSGHTCALTPTGRAFCWGFGRHGELGTGKAIVSHWPRAVAGGLYFERVTAGGGHTCGEIAGDRAYCWGYNAYGQLGDGTTTDRLTPRPVTGGLYFGQVTAGSDHTCGRTPAGVAYCWGDNYLGGVGDGTWQNTRPSPTPVAEPTLTTPSSSPSISIARHGRRG